ncbi:MAG: hypothetical protein HQ559_00120 [Lentisphaerae bacterium]|nr:hypothetical protein [Lentisphaerota bacterium]
MKSGWILVAACMIAAAAFGEEEAVTSYLRAGDHIVFIGDSITEMGHYGNMVQRALTTAYPDAGIKAVNHGSGGKTASGGITLLNHYLGSKPTIVCVMFAVNDTKWSAGGEDAKAAEFVANLEKFAGMAEMNGFELVFIRESHFSHNAYADPWVAGLNKVVERLLDEQDRVAAKHGIPVIDAYGAYIKALGKAWAQDPLYEFTPDVVHPLLPGSAAMAGEILSAFGVGLPLSDKKRGALNLQPDAGMSIQVLEETGICPEDAGIPLRVRVSSLTQNPAKGTLACVSGPWTTNLQVSAQGFDSVILETTLPVRGMTGRVTCAPVHALFSEEERVATAQSLLYVSRIVDIAKSPYTVQASDLRPFQGAAREDGPPLKSVSVTQTGEGIETVFTWRDKTPVAASNGFRNRFNVVVEEPVDLRSRAGGQPCDVVEFLFDLRPEATAGRYTASADANPEGVIRIGVYLTKTDGNYEATALAEPASFSDKVKLETTDSGTYKLKLLERPAGYTFGFTTLVTDSTEFKPGAGIVYHLTGTLPPDPTDFVRLGRGIAGSFYRIGY